MLAMEPILVLITLYLSLVYGLLYARAYPLSVSRRPHTYRIPLVFQAFPVIFIERRGFTIAQDGLMFIGIGIGTTIGSLINVFATAHYPQLIAKWKGFPPPEHRLFGAMIGSPALAIGAFWLGWTGEYSSIPWYVPGLSAIVIGMAISLIFISFLVCYSLSFKKNSG
jgi:DHA1 family multidrug resistance protein-like MFS transporter